MGRPPATASWGVTVPPANQPDHASMPWSRRLVGSLGLRPLLFLAFFAVAALPLAAVAYWDARATLQNEVESASRRNLQVAQNLADVMSHYVSDLTAAFNVVFDADTINNSADGIEPLLRSLGLLHVCIVNADGEVVSALGGLSDRRPMLGPAVMASLWALAARPDPQPKLTNLEPDAAGVPVFYIVKMLPNRHLGVGMISLDYLVSLQRQIAFGDHAYAVITDGTGRVVAHPMSDWMAGAHDLSDLDVVQQMMHAEAGTTHFFSPAFHAEMIAGYAAVPVVGWGVMVAQPLSDLQNQANQVGHIALIVAGIAFLLGAGLSWLIAGDLSRPVGEIAQAVEAVQAGHPEIAQPGPGTLVPREIRRLGAAFSGMLADRRQREAETIAALHRLEHNNQAKTRLLAAISQRIRTQLTSALGALAMLRQTELAPGQVGPLDRAVQSSRSLLRLADDLRDTALIEAGDPALDPAPFHLPSLLHDARLLSVEAARAKGIVLSSLVPEALNVALVGDPRRLLHMLLNVLGCAISHAGGGEVSLGVACEDDLGTALRLRFSIITTDAGIESVLASAHVDAVAQPAVFAAPRDDRGGLELSIAQRLCEAMAGTINVLSRPAGGAEFAVTLALAKATEAQRLVLAPPPVAPQPTSSPPVTPADLSEVASPEVAAFRDSLRQAGRDSIRVLLADDNLPNLALARAMLETLGCRVTEAQNGLEAVAAYRSESFDLVLMDCHMPEMDGIEATRVIRQIETFRGGHTPIIALTADAMEENRGRSMEAGMDDRVLKPLTFALLASRIDGWLATAA